MTAVGSREVILEGYEFLENPYDVVGRRENNRMNGSKNGEGRWRRPEQSRPNSCLPQSTCRR